MEAHTETTVIAAINAACDAAKAGVRLYNAVCDVPGVLGARQRRGLFGLGKHLAGNSTAADLDCIAVDFMLTFIGNSAAMSPDERYDLVGYLSQEASARPAPQPCRPLASTDDIALCLALDAAALVRLSIFRVARSAANLDMALEWAQEGDTEGERAIPVRLLLDAHEPVGLAISATRVALRVFLNLNRTHHIVIADQQLAVGYDSIFAAARLDIQNMMVSIRADIASPTLDPAVASTAPYLAKELATIAHNVAGEVSARDSSILGSIAENAGAVANLAAETSEAYDTALKSILT